MFTRVALRSFGRAVGRPFDAVPASHMLGRWYSTPSTQTDSLLGSLTPGVTTDDSLMKGTPEQEEDTGQTTEVVYVEPKDDKDLQKYLNTKPYKTVNSLMSPLKRRLFLDNVAQNGFFKNSELVTLKDGSKYRLQLSREEIEALEPSVYLRSWRIKSSVKKTNPVLRALKDLPLKKAITQLHFMPKKVARELAEMLERGLEDAKTMNYDPNSLYVAESWVHTDGSWVKRVDCKGRGRSGIIRHRWVSVRFLLKSEQTRKRLAYETQKRADQLTTKTVLRQEPIRGKPVGWYKW